MITIYTDGASTQVNKQTYIADNEIPLFEAGWAMCIKTPKKTLVRYGYLPVPSSNNRGELIAVIEALEFIKGVKSDETFKVISDSQYVTKGINEYMRNWYKKDWDNVKNPDLWKHTWGLWEDVKHKTTVEWVRGHDGNEGNELADTYAVHGKKRYVPNKKENIMEVFLEGNRPYEQLPD